MRRVNLEHAMVALGVTRKDIAAKMAVSIQRVAFRAARMSSVDARWFEEALDLPTEALDLRTRKFLPFLYQDDEEDQEDEEEKRQEEQQAAEDLVYRTFATVVPPEWAAVSIKNKP